MTARELTGRSLAFGLSWLPPGEIPPGRSESRRTRDLLKLRPQPVCHAEIELPLTTQVAVSADPDDAGHVSAAAWLAAAQKSAVLVEQLGDDEYWLCVVEDGVVFPAGDIVGSYDRIAARITELETDLAGARISCYDRLGRFGLSEAKPLDFSDLTSGTDPSEDWMVRKIGRQRSRKPLISIAAAALCIAAGYGAWHWHSLSPEPPAVDQSDVTARMRQLEQEKAALLETLAQDAGRLVTALVREVSDRPRRAVGWRSVSASWTSGGVEIEWQRAHGSYLALASHLAGRQFALDERSGAVTERYQLVAPATAAADIGQVLKTGPLQRYALLDAVARLPGRWTLASAQMTGVEYPVRKSALTGSVTGFAEAQAAAHFFSAHPVHLRSVSIQLDSRPAWQFAGDVYESAN